ncbi:acid protease [Mycena amicta]|nr:acid protease [Mycena amicta]
MLSRLALLPLLLVVLRCGVVATQIDQAHIVLARQMNQGPLSKHDKAHAQALRAQGEHPGPSAKRANSVQVTNTAITYTANVTIGEIAYTLLIDTGSSNTWLGNSKPYVPTLNSRPDRLTPVYVPYGSGVEMFEKVSLAPSLTIPNQSIAVSEPPIPQGFPETIDGILGIGPSGLTKGTQILAQNKQIPTVADNLFNQGSISKPMIGIYYQPTAAAGNGNLTLGGVDNTKIISDIHYTDITSTLPASRYWGIQQSISYGGLPLLSQTAGILDTGTTLVLIATDAFLRYKAATKATVDEATGLLTIPNDQFVNLKNLDFNISGRNFTLTPDAQIWPRQLNSLVGGVAGSIYLAWISSMATPSWSGFYSVYDSTGSGRVGLAQTQYTRAELNY